ncbi:hypothetical protein [Paenibacillus wulumuqiensis]|uniref:hypothetical protein n=1 Tax=Paenibacillus wulumuqiensis TaxID=1567107 RepID=UPI00069669FC|nr:hypothetical protein [Paenibacillus wulumuqiensis]
MKHMDEYIISRMYGTFSTSSSSTTELKNEESVLNTAAERSQEETVITIDEKPIRFTAVELSEKGIACLLPDYFAPMPTEEARMKYPSEQRPTVIYCNPEGTVDFTLNPSDMEAEDHELEQIAKQLSVMLRDVQPIRSWKGMETLTTEHMTLIIMRFVTSAIDGHIYNEMLLFNRNGRLQIGTFHCEAEQMEQWEPVTEVIIRSLRLLTEREHTYESGLS